MSNSMAARDTGPRADGGLTHRQVLTIISGLLAGMFLSALDQTIVSSAMRVIADELHGQTAQAWATTAYLITATISTPLYGKLSDIYGRKPMYLTAITVFVVGSALCGVAASIYQLAAFRAVQGLGAGGLMSLALTIVADIVSPRQRGRYQGYFMAVFGVSSVLGPVLGGFFADLDDLAGVAGWRWVFLVNVPVGVVAFLIVAKVLNIPHHPVRHRVDYWGAAALVVGLVPLLTVAEQGREWGWSSPLSLLMFAVGTVGLVAFVLVERRMGDEALLPPRLFRSGTFRLANVLNFVVGLGMFGGMMSVPLYLQIVKGLSPTEAGLMMLPTTFGIMVATGVVGQLIARTGRLKVFPILGTGLLTLSYLLFSQVTVDTPLWQIGLVMVVLGGGLGQCMQTLTLYVQNDAPPRDSGAATASANFFRQNGGTVGVAVFLSVLFSVVGDRITSAFESAARTPEFQRALTDPAVQADPANERFLASLEGAGGGSAGLDLNDTSFLNGLDPRLARPVLEGFASAVGTVFLIGLGVVALAFALSWFLRDVHLSDRSNLEQLAAERAAAQAEGAPEPSARSEEGTARGAEPSTTSQV
ncbi:MULTISPECIES: DHA2 family efflux MFS transporter permease subunit [Actinoalloteichus]|uniref:Drug resistance transporter, EmrB/QacA subfamily n=1 Tax=Actinoalloteichus caeruleus DSM 43889 TaxID=1120930 RepID=A0ABT1JJJ9_ACTCY|nr:DHA2 family efflux MFS transporter permease subunit [Actinoalloteichus caeruleus]MCP2332691.1 drug resistance transporter, EmrB/QacA subfamily [Actinoalloteichus caeruleus DSM 43889]